LSDEPCFSLREHDVFPGTFASFFFPNARLRKIFLRKHSDLVDPAYWKNVQQIIRAGEQADVFPYAQKQRFKHRFADRKQLKRRNAA